MSMLARGTICGYRGKRLTASQRARFLQHGIDNWPIQNVAHRLLYLRMMFVVEALFTLICKKAKASPPRIAIDTGWLKRITSNS